MSHGQGALVAHLLDDLVRLASTTISRIVVTRNLPEAWCPTTAVELIDNPSPKGFAANHNAAFRCCDTPFFAIINPDVRIEQDPFAALLALFTQGPRIALASPMIVNREGLVEDFRRELPTLPSLLRRHVLHDANPSNEDWLAGMFLIVRSEVFARLGGFDERFRLYCEDFDLCARVRLAGHAFAVADAARVVHDGQRASRRSLRYLLWHVRSLLRVWFGPVFWRYRTLLRQRPS